MSFLNSIEKRKKEHFISKPKKKLVRFQKIKKTWGAQGQMTQLNLIVNSLPRDLLEFAFFLVVGFTAGSVGIIW